MNLGDTAIRSALHTSLIAAWNPVRIYDDPPFLPGSSAELPRAFIVLQDIEPSIRGDGAGARDAILPHTYAITGQFARPNSGTIEADKVTKAQTLLSVLTADLVRYAGWRRRITAIRFRAGEITVEDEVSEPYHTVTVEIQLDVITDA